MQLMTMEGKPPLFSWEIRKIKVIDLEFDKNVVYHHPKMDNLSTAINMGRKNCLMTIVDLSNAYYTIPITKEHHKYFLFWFEGKIHKSFVFQMAFHLFPEYLENS